MRPDDRRKHEKCTNCLTQVTPLWRRSARGKSLCNACGLYFKNHRAHRPTQRTCSLQKDCLVESLECIAVLSLLELRQSGRQHASGKNSCGAPGRSLAGKRPARSGLLRNKERTSSPIMTNVDEAVRNLASMSNK